MPQQTKIFRVFVSSTFSDMKEERRILQRDVFPRLERYCEQNGAKFQAVDLRWGVSEESSLNQKTLDICLNEIARCQKISPKPNFLVLLGDKYGWQPLPPRIPETEMEEILNVCSNRKLLEEWYRKDINADPPEYLLQPRADENKVDATWQKTEQELLQILREAVKKLPFRPDQQLKYYTSATHQEIISGALQTEDLDEDPAEHVFAMVRETDGIPGDQTAGGYIDLLNGKQDPYSAGQLAGLKEDLRKLLDKRYHIHEAKWKNGKAEISDEKAFAEQVYAYLHDIIAKQIEEIISPDEIDLEKRLHREFKEKLTLNFIGRETILEKISTYRTDTGNKTSLALVGASGSGKSSVMAQAVALAEKDLSQATIVYRFIGTSSRSSNIISLLQSVCGEIAQAYGETLESLAGEGNEKNLHDINGISEVFRNALALGTAEKPLLIFLDALDQLNESDNAHALYWLPQELPEHTKIVVSSLKELEEALRSCTREQLPVLPKEDAEKILDRWLAGIRRRLTPDQQKEVFSKFSHSQLPIYLRLAYEQAKHWHSYTEDYLLKEDVSGIINDFISLLEKEHSPDFVQDVICLMLCGRYQGLAENEILEIFAFDDGLWDKFLQKTHPDQRSELVEMRTDFKDNKLEGSMKIPIVVWSRLYLDLEPYLTERDADGVPIITFFHRQFNEVLRGRYGLNVVEP